MKSLPIELAVLAALIVALLAASMAQDELVLEVQVLSCYDGDTCTVMLPLGSGVAPWVHDLFGTQKVRILGYDTPEIRGGCEESKVLAFQARDLLRRLVATADVVQLRRIIPTTASSKGDPYGRMLAEMWVDGANVRDALMAAGLAREYDGQTARLSWCSP